jgi:hypothetical protein
MTTILLDLFLDSSRIAKLTDFLDTSSGIAAILPDHVVTAVRCADDIRPMQQASLFWIVFRM